MTTGNKNHKKCQLIVDGLTKIKELMNLYTSLDGAVILNKIAANLFVVVVLNAMF